MTSILPWYKYIVAHYILETTKTDILVPDNKNLTWLNPESGLVEYVGEPSTFKFQYKDLEFADLLNNSEYDTENLMNAKKILNSNKHIEINIKKGKEILKITEDGKIALENDYYIKERNRRIIFTFAIISGIVAIATLIK